MIPTLQTHFNAPVDLDTLRQVRALGFQMVRIDAQDSSVDLMLQLIAEAAAVDLRAYVTVATHEQIEALPAGTLAEWLNEPDLALGRPAPIPPATYATSLIDAAAVAYSNPVGQIGGPVISNLNKRGCDYLGDVLIACGGQFPDNVFGVTHRYGDGTYDTPHKLKTWNPFGAFHSREEELRWFKDTIGEGRPWGVSEFGYPSFEGLSEDDQADRIRQEWDLYTREGALFASLFQINDGPQHGFREHHYGIRRCDAFGVLGDWKPAAFTLPNVGAIVPNLGTPEDTMIQATFSISRKMAIPHPDKPGYFTSPYRPTDGPDGVLSVQADGSIQVRPAGTTGPWESWRPDGNRAVFDDVAGKVFALPLVD